MEIKLQIPPTLETLYTTLNAHRSYLAATVATGGLWLAAVQVRRRGWPEKLLEQLTRQVLTRLEAETGLPLRPSTRRDWLAGLKGRLPRLKPSASTDPRLRLTEALLEHLARTGQRVELIEVSEGNGPQVRATEAAWIAPLQVTHIGGDLAVVARISDPLAGRKLLLFTPDEVESLAVMAGDYLTPITLVIRRTR